MKEFKLARVMYKNIMSVGQKPIEIFLNKAQKTLVTGVNGAGKSTFIEAITFALYGKPFRDIKKGQLINSTNKKDMYVELEMYFNSKHYLIKRGQKPTIFEIYVDQERLDESASSKDFQEYFEELIGMSYNAFKQVVVLGTAGYTPFMGLTTPNRRKLVEDLLEVTALSEIDKLNKTNIRELNQNIQIADMKCGHIKTEIKTHQDYAEQQRKTSGDNLTRLNTMYDTQVQNAKSDKAKYDALVKEFESITLPENVQNELQQVKSKIIEVRTAQSSLGKVLSLYKEGGSCPTCMQQLSDDALVGKVQDKFNTHQHTLDHRASELRVLVEQQKEYESISNKLNSIQREQTQIKTQIQTLVANAKRIKSMIDKAQEEFIDNSGKITELQTDLEAQLNVKSDLVMEKYHRGIIVEMLKDSGIKSAIVKKYIPYFNKQINHYLKIMGADYSFELNEEFTETIKSRGREAFSYASFSQGEKARIDIALLFTWRDVASKVTGVKISTLILDEVADSATDVEGVKAIQSILDADKELHSFIISHRDHNPQDYGQHIRMKKIGRYTVLG